MSARLLAAAKVYAFNYLQDEAEEEECCTCGPKQHAEAKELFAAIKEAEADSANFTATQAAQPTDETVLLMGIQALCVALDQECCRGQGILSEWDKGWFSGQMHVFDMYTRAPKEAMDTAREYISRVFAESDKGTALAIQGGEDARDAESIIPSNWRLYTADFSIRAGRNPDSLGSVTLIRDTEGRKEFASLDEEGQEAFQLYTYGTGRTIREAIESAVAAILATQSQKG